jgi:dethiobiotin synthetase
MRYFVTGNDTEVGKTIISAILVQALGADYWKPVQAGGEESDTEIVRSLVTNSRSNFHVEKFVLSQPMSPHAAAAIDGVELTMDRFGLPDTLNDLVIEGAGGVLVPLNNQDMVIDLIAAFDARAVVVSKNYLGSINHTLLTLEALKRRSIPIAGVIFNGEQNVESEQIIERISAVPVLGRIPQFAVNPDTVSRLGGELDLATLCGEFGGPLVC